ncbi:NAD(P)H-hydrate dehydratase [Algisphaera agarilytica]|uniref:ADP-dependent (S)-NAD(P)H-hydrate dehydratase n=1 Tax=Algisphaera agarilytica TaxID=1385975 RepID=A0A7X0H404_9BACT|nr:NAD(P)H-hydrate dehydratase [Algisphaera agarilytica]MBB6428794.1 NAD(P)H-hydrate epimerase [Algisphaera agarilytica]
MKLDWVESLPALPPRPEDGHKGTFGTVVVVGGSLRMPGAPALCATAALRGGVGLVKVAGALQVLASVLAIQPSATGIGLKDLGGAKGDGKTVIAIGPGLGQEKGFDVLVRGFLDWPNPLVVDADGLNALAIGEAFERSSDKPWVLTPHPGEFRRLAEQLGIEGDPTDPQQRPDAAAALARATGAVVLLKGQHTIVSDGHRVYRNTTGNPVLATAGTGDVLTGLIASLLAQGCDAFDAGVLGAHLHGSAADAWRDANGSRGMLAMELAGELPAAIARLENA